MITRISVSNTGMYYGERLHFGQSEHFPNQHFKYWQSVTGEFMFKFSAYVALWWYKHKMRRRTRARGH